MIRHLPLIYLYFALAFMNVMHYSLMIYLDLICINLYARGSTFPFDSLSGRVGPFKTVGQMPSKRRTSQRYEGCGKKTRIICATCQCTTLNYEYMTSK